MRMFRSWFLVIKMATVLEDCNTEEQRSVFRSLWAKGRRHATDIHTEMFPVYDEKCLSGKAVLNWVEKLPQVRSKVADVHIAISSHLLPIY
jgi:hypothetical protein